MDPSEPPGNPQATPSQPPGNPQAIPSQLRPDAEQKQNKKSRWFDKKGERKQISCFGANLPVWSVRVEQDSEKHQK